jgi:RES domain-containing protein
MQVYRLTKKSFSTSLSGTGAAKAGGRWNSKGTEIIYTSESRSLSMLEKYIHLPPGIIPKDFVMMNIDIPEETSMKCIDVKTLATDWKDDFQIPNVRKIGDDFITKNSVCILKVPSALVPGDHNYLINPAHPDFANIRIVSIDEFPFDDRLFS